MKAKILFATLNFDGHFKPLTSLAKHLQLQGYDVRWYTDKMYQQLENVGLCASCIDRWRYCLTRNLPGN